MKVRYKTWDTAICESVITNNEYGLPSSMAGMVVVDIGAHIGAFAAACAAREAKRVICYEPDPENFNLLKANITELASNPETITVFELYNTAVTGEATSNLKLRHLRNHDFGSGDNTGHIDIFGLDEINGIQSTGINSVLQAAHSPVNLLKLDCEGAEWSIFESGDFTNVHYVVAELHLISPGEHPLYDVLADMSLSELTLHAVRSLQKYGLHPKIRAMGDDLGLLVAERPVVSAAVATKKVLWIGHAGIQSGYSKVTKNICRRLFEMGWDVRVYGVGYSGEPHTLPYRIYPADTHGTRLKALINEMEPDAVVMLDDHWNVATHMQTMAAHNMYPPSVGYVAVDSENVRKDVVSQLRALKHAVFHTEFGLEQFKKAGYIGQASIAGHGVDTKLYGTYDKADARSKVQLAVPRAKLQDAFIWGVVGMNQPRKRLDLSLAYFAEWWKCAGKPANVYLYIHCNHDGVWDITQLSDYLGIRGQVLTTSTALPENQMPAMYSIFDVMLSTAESESWGMCQHEGAACGIPQIAVRCGGMPSWAGEAMYWVEPSQYAFTPNRTNTKRWVASEEDFVAALHAMYTDESLRKEYRQRGLELVRRLPSWDDIALHFHKVQRNIIPRRQDASSVSLSA